MVTSKVGGPPPERFVGQPSGDGVARATFLPAAPTPSVLGNDPTGQQRPIGLEALSGHLQPELVEAAERGQVRAREGSVRHVEVFQMGGVGTSIFGRPRRLPRDRRADQRYTLNCEEPHSSHHGLEQPHRASRLYLHVDLDVRPVTLRQQAELELASCRARSLLSLIHI